MSEDTPDTPHTNPSPISGLKTSGAAIWSLVLGLISTALFLNLLSGIPAIFLGIVALKKIRNAPDQLKGKGIAMTGIATGAIGSLIAPIMVAIALPTYLQNKDRADQVKMVAEMRMVSNSCQSYAIDNGGFPEALDDLFPVYLSNRSHLTWTNPATGSELPYIYIPGADPDSVRIEPLLISPTDFCGERVIIYNSGTLERTTAGAAKALLETIPRR